MLARASAGNYRLRQAPTPCSGECARLLRRLSRVTVRRYIEADGYPERAPTRTRHSQLKKYVPYLHQRFAAGCNNATQMWREISAKGYGGKAGMVRRYIKRMRVRTKELGVKRQLEIQSAVDNFKSPSSRRAAWWLIKEV